MRPSAAAVIVLLVLLGQILELRGMLHNAGLNKPEYHRFDPLFRL